MGLKEKLRGIPPIVCFKSDIEGLPFYVLEKSEKHLREDGTCKKDRISLKELNSLRVEYDIRKDEWRIYISDTENYVLAQNPLFSIS